MGDAKNAVDNIAKPKEVDQTIPIVILGVILAVVLIFVIIYCAVKQKKKKEKEKQVDGAVEEGLIEANNTRENFAELDVDDEKPSELKSGPRPKPTRNPEMKKWYDSKAIPFMDEKGMSIENLDVL